jgi:hypothetical protein
MKKNTQALSDAIRLLFQELRTVPLNPHLRNSAHENMLDVLEICAVAYGRKRAHLNGQGTCDPASFEAFISVAHRHGLRTKITDCLTSGGRSQEERKLGPLVQAKLDEISAASKPPHGVLWIYDASADELLIDQAAAGDNKALRVLLGYPSCCVDFHEAEYLRYKDDFLNSLKKQYGATTAGDVVALLSKNVPVVTGHEPFSPARSKFPYIGHTPCPACVNKDSQSPTGKLNLAMRELAFFLDRDFGRSVWEAAREEDRSLKFMLRETTSNGPCPCGSGRKLKACCEAW